MQAKTLLLIDMTSTTKNTKSNLSNSIRLSDKIKLYRKKISNSFILIEIGSNYITLALLKVSKNKLNFRNFNQIFLPSEAIDKYAPSDPSKMGKLIESILEENNMHTLRVAVVVSSELAYTRLLDIPKEFNSNEAYEYVSNPSSKLSLPISISQTDFDITPTTLVTRKNNVEITKYLLTSVPQKSIDSIVSTIRGIGLDLYKIDISYICQLRLLIDYLNDLTNDHYIVFLELTTDCTHFVLADSKGPISVDRLASIRDYPSPEDNQSQAKSNDSNKEYLPISKMDVRIMLRDLSKKIQSSFNEHNLSGKIDIYINGRNSNHPNIVEIISKSMKSAVYHISPFNSISIGNISHNPKVISEQSLGRIIGLGIGLLEEKYLFNNDNASFHIINQFVPEKSMIFTPNKNKEYNSYRYSSKKTRSNLLSKEIPSKTTNFPDNSSSTNINSKLNDTFIDKQEVNYKIKSDTLDSQSFFNNSTNNKTINTNNVDDNTLPSIENISDTGSDSTDLTIEDLPLEPLPFSELSKENENPNTIKQDKRLINKNDDSDDEFKFDPGFLDIDEE